MAESSEGALEPTSSDKAAVSEGPTQQAVRRCLHCKKTTFKGKRKDDPDAVYCSEVCKFFAETVLYPDPESVSVPQSSGLSRDNFKVQPLTRFSNAQSQTLTLMTSVDQCIVCPSGTFCPVGSDIPTNCAPGTFNDGPGNETCANCEAGSFQDASGKTACKSCTQGYYCASGSAAPLPCPGGTHKDATLTVMTSVDQCIVCPAGTFCSVGSASPTPCAPGTYNPLAEQSTCVNCAAGTFQALAGNTTCLPCTPGCARSRSISMYLCATFAVRLL